MMSILCEKCGWRMLDTWHAKNILFALDVVQEVCIIEH